MKTGILYFFPHDDLKKQCVMTDDEAVEYFNPVSVETDKINGIIVLKLTLDDNYPGVLLAGLPLIVEQALRVPKALEEIFSPSHFVIRDGVKYSTINRIIGTAEEIMDIGDIPEEWIKYE